MQDLSFSMKLNHICRQNDVKFISGDVYGLFAYSFTDFGPKFDCVDVDGEDYKAVFVSSIRVNENDAEENEAFIETIDQKPHNLEANDFIRLSEVKSDSAQETLFVENLNSTAFKVTKCLNSFTFKIGLSSIQSSKSFYSLKCGIFKKVKKVGHIEFNSLRSEISKPSLLFSDLNESKFYNPYFVHILIVSHQSLSVNYSFEEFQAKVNETFSRFKSELSQENAAETLNKLTRVFYLSARGKFPPLSAVYGGVIGQEVLKSITYKFLPVRQWLYLDCSELFEANVDACLFEKNAGKNDRYDNLRFCFGGEKTLNKLFATKLFMVGCGAIGCEMLKNYALLGKLIYSFSE